MKNDIIRIQETNKMQKTVTIPKPIAFALGWNKWDKLQITLVARNKIQLEKVD